MKIKVLDIYNIPQSHAISKYVAGSLHGVDAGIIESVERTNQNIAEALGRLLDYMAQNGQIACATEITYIVEGVRRTSVLEN